MANCQYCKKVLSNNQPMKNMHASDCKADEDMRSVA